MKEKWEKIKKPLCAVIMVIFLFFLLGCTGTAECGGELTTYVIQSTVLLSVTIAAVLISGIFG